MKNLKYLATLMFITGTIQAQNALDIPSSSEFSNYLHARQDDIEEKLYKLVLSGEVKPYKNDSFTSIYNMKEFKERGGMEKQVYFDSIICVRADSDRVPFSPKDIQEIWFAEHVGNSKEMISVNTLKGIALIYQPMFSGIRTNSIPLCWIKTPDLIKSLPRQDFDFLLQLLHYGRNTNGVRELAEKDVFYWLNMTGERTIMADSSLVNKIAGMLVYSEFYLEEQLYLVKGPKSIANRIFDDQLRKFINLDTFNRHYIQEVSIFIQTNPDNPMEGRDSVMYLPMQLKTVYAVSYDNKTKQLTNYHARLYQPGVKRQEIHTFSIPVNRNYTAIKSIIWFYEDYIRWKKI